MAHKDQSSWWSPKNWRLSWPLARQVLLISGLGVALAYSIWLGIGTDNFAGYILLASVLLFILIRIGYRYEWTGFGETLHPKSENNEIQPRKTLWDWMSLLLVPSMIALLGFGLTWYLNNSEQARQAEEAARAEVIRSHVITLQAYLDQMSALQVEKALPYSQEDSAVRLLAKARTLAALRAVGPENRRTLLLFLYDTRLIDRRDTIISLADADLHGSNLRSANLSHVVLSGVDLSDANLSDANGVTEEQLEEQARTLEGATMPDGSKHL